MAKQSIGITEVAEEVGLSKSTVSFVLNGRDREMKIAPETAQLVQHTAKKLGYRSNHWARSLALQQTTLIGVLFPDLHDSAAHQTLKGIHSVLEETGYEPLISVYFWDPQKQSREVELMLERRVDGIIALPHTESPESYAPVLDEDIPIVFCRGLLP